MDDPCARQGPGAGRAAADHPGGKTCGHGARRSRRWCWKRVARWRPAGAHASTGRTLCRLVPEQVRCADVHHGSRYRALSRTRREPWLHPSRTRGIQVRGDPIRCTCSERQPRPIGTHPPVHDYLAEPPSSRSSARRSCWRGAPGSSTATTTTLRSSIRSGDRGAGASEWQPGLLLSGGVENPPGDYPAGGPFIVARSRLSGSGAPVPRRRLLYAPGRDKYEYMVQLEEITGSFRCTGL